MRAFVVLLCLLVGCSNTSRSGDGPADDHTPDGGVAAAEDAAVEDASADVDPADAGPMCEEELLEVPRDRPCEASTRECAEACSESTCVDECLAADTNPGCRNCLNRVLLACFNRSGCQPQWNCYRACVKSECDGAADLDACLQMHCVELEDAYVECTDALWDDTGCGARYLDCLPEE